MNLLQSMKTLPRSELFEVEREGWFVLDWAKAARSALEAYRHVCVSLCAFTNGAFHITPSPTVRPEGCERLWRKDQVDARNEIVLKNILPRDFFREGLKS